MLSFSRITGLIGLFALTACQSSLAAEEDPAARVDASRIAFAAAVQADADGDAVTALAAIQEAAALRPKHPTLALNAAAMEAQAGLTAVATLRLAKLADMGVGMNLRAQPAFEVLAGRDDFERIADRMAAQAEPVGETPLELELGWADGTNVLPEGLASSTDFLFGPLFEESDSPTFFVSSVARGEVRAGDQHGVGKLVDLPEGVGAYGIALDPSQRWLWITTAPVPGQEGTAPRSGLVLVRLTSVRAIVGEDGEVQMDGERIAAQLPGKQDAQLSDLLLIESGTALISDSAGGTVWMARLLPVGDSFELRFSPWMKGPGLPSPQGLAQARGGIYLADYSTGVHRLSKSGERLSLLKPDDLSDLGIDGLVSVGQRHLIAVQNGFAPQRILWLTLSEDGEAITDWEVLAAAQPEWREPTLGVVEGDWFYFIANSHWPDFADFENPVGPQGPPQIRKLGLPID